MILGVVWFVGHIVGERPPSLLSWLIAAVWGAALVAGFLTKRNVRRAAFALAFVGIAGSIWDEWNRGQRPPRPNLTIQLVLPSTRTTMPVPVKVCGFDHAGESVNPTADGRWLLVRVDGIQVAEVHATQILIPVRPGRHALSAEVNSPYHQEFVAPLKISRTIDVEARDGTISFPGCPTSNSRH